MMQNRAYLTNKCDDLKLSLKWKQKYRIFGSSSPEINPDDWVEVENVRTCGVDENQIVLGNTPEASHSTFTAASQRH